MKIYFRPQPKITGRLHEYPLIFSKRFTISLHKIIDPGFIITDPHDHPSNFVSIGLKGFYVERLFDNSLNLKVHRDVKRRWVHIMRTHQAHYIIDAPKPAWTLFITWGFRGYGSRIYTKTRIYHPKDYYANGIPPESVIYKESHVQT